LLEQDISRLQREVNESFTRLLEQTDAAATIPEADPSVSQMSAEVNAQIDQASAASVRLGADIALLRDSVAELNDQHTQAEVLNALIARVANFAPRVVLFVVKGANALAWAARGVEENGTNVRGLAVALHADTALRAALNSQQTFYGSPDEHPENQLVFGRLGNFQPQRVLAVPLKVRGKSAAIIYADSSDHGESAINVEAIELLVHNSGLVVELVSLRSRVSEGAPQPARQPAAPPAQPAAAAPEAQQPSAPAQQAPAQPAAAEPPQRTTAPLPESRPAPSEELPPQVDTLPEFRSPIPPPPPSAPTFFRPTEPPQPAEPIAPPPQPAQDLWAAPKTNEQAAVRPPAAAPPAGSVTTEEEKEHNAARRFARLLVSEIKLYNEQKVTEGRRNNDLYDRLKEDIDRSRQMYDKRVTPQVASKFDYFYDELVNVLAEGDPVKLGSDYPGPSVAV
jgi:hypothetical protein